MAHMGSRTSRAPECFVDATSLKVHQPLRNPSHGFCFSSSLCKEGVPHYS